MPEVTILCWKTSLPTASGHVTIADYINWRDAGEDGKPNLAQFIKERLYERYIDPVNALISEEKNGFAVMALSCLLIETLESFYQGWPKSPNSQLAFCNFFDRHTTFHDFKGYAQGFYKNVRCGILHQGETIKRWTLTRKPDAPLFDKESLTVHATKFHHQLSEAVTRYAEELKESLITDDLWEKFYKKMNATVEQCG